MRLLHCGTRLLHNESDKICTTSKGYIYIFVLKLQDINVGIINDIFLFKDCFFYMSSMRFKRNVFKGINSSNPFPF